MRLHRRLYAVTNYMDERGGLIPFARHFGKEPTRAQSRGARNSRRKYEILKAFTSFIDAVPATRGRGPALCAPHISPADRTPSLLAVPGSGRSQSALSGAIGYERRICARLFVLVLAGVEDGGAR